MINVECGQWISFGGRSGRGGGGGGGSTGFRGLHFGRGIQEGRGRGRGLGLVPLAPGEVLSNTTHHVKQVTMLLWCCMC